MGTRGSIPHPRPSNLELRVPPTPHSALLTLSLGPIPAGSSTHRGDAPGLMAHDECQEQPLVRWAQQLLALIKKGETRQLSGCDSQFCCPQPGLPEAKWGGPASPGREAGYPPAPRDPTAGQGCARTHMCVQLPHQPRPQCARTECNKLRDQQGHSTT